MLRHWLVNRLTAWLAWLVPEQQERLDAKTDYWYTLARQEIRSEPNGTFEVRAFDVWHKEKQLGVLTVFHNSHGAFANFTNV